MTEQESRTQNLPKWAQERIADLERQRDIAVRRLDEMTDSQTPSPFFHESYDCTESPPVSRKVYHQSGIRMSVLYEGVLLDVILRDKAIELTWGDPDRAIGAICCQPHSYQQIRLLTKENMR